MAMRDWQDVTPAQAAGLGKQLGAPVSKYRSTRTQVDGIWFHSKREAQRFHELKLLEKAGQIQDLLLQPRYALHVRDVVIGHYIADFCYRTGKLHELVVEDVKGMKGLPLYQWKKKHMAAEYGIVVQEIR
jgi:hypothetical protein